MLDRFWLDVPYADKDAAKSLGARWDSGARRWYAPREALLVDLTQWAPRVPEVLPGEDRTFGRGLYVDLIPSTSWFTNVRSCVDPGQWDALRSMVYRRAGQRCEICGADRGQGRNRLEAHERWSYDTASSVQTLRRLIALCWSCHRTTHYGFGEVTGTADLAIAHLRAVNGWSAADAQAHIDTAYELWSLRSTRLWQLDLRILTDAGIKIVQPQPIAMPRPVTPQATAVRPPSSRWSHLSRLLHRR